MLVWMAGEELATPQQRSRVMRGLTMMGKLAAAPFIGLGFIVLGPFVALGTLLGGIVRIQGRRVSPAETSDRLPDTPQARTRGDTMNDKVRILVVDDEDVVRRC
ncbi:MAG: hypothetical protein IPP44_07840 [Ideonella sp.]|nr:hypothetical protein [Ideonella sp.]